MKTEIIKCDTCGSQEKVKSIKLSVVFTTEQDEGRACEPYLEILNLDICEPCKKYMIENRRLVQAEGAMGYNAYFLKK